MSVFCFGLSISEQQTLSSCLASFIVWSCVAPHPLLTVDAEMFSRTVDLRVEKNKCLFVKQFYHCTLATIDNNDNSKAIYMCIFFYVFFSPYFLIEMASSVDEYLDDSDEDLISCHVCLWRFNDGDRKPKFLDCHHYFCLSCIKVLGQI